jgi:hypothetical protein
VADPYEHGNEPLDSVKGGGFVVYLCVLLASEEGFRCVELVVGLIRILRKIIVRLNEGKYVVEI